MKIVVAVCVYNRFENIKTWIRCWEQCDTTDAELVIVHNYYGNKTESARYEKHCIDNGIKYIPRSDGGFDIGAFQDVCKNRLTGFPDYDYLLWCTDDVLPMNKDFISLFINKLSEPGIGVSAMDISDEYDRHIRTTGFCLKKDTAAKLSFKADPISTKMQCYGFEHRDGSETFFNQIVSMGLKPEMVSAANNSPLWDTGYLYRLNRQPEHDLIFSNIQPKDKVVVICPVYNMYPQIISSLICQTHKNWELLLINNGSELNGLDSIIKGYNDDRVNFIVYPEQTGNYGHPLRAWALQSIRENNLSTDAEYVIITNADNYYSPTFIQYMLNGFRSNQHAVACYCSDMVHSYLNWATQPCWLERGHIDCGGVMIRKDIASSFAWRSYEHSSDWIYFNDIIQKHGADKWIKVKGTLFVHN
ncbi:MAG: glycosyltransferase family A protein [Ginsengibacter sp.]